MREELCNVGCPTEPQANARQDLIYLSTASDSVSESERVKELLALFEEGDTLIVYQVDHSARDAQNGKTLRDIAGAMGVNLTTTDVHDTAGGTHAK